MKGKHNFTSNKTENNKVTIRLTQEISSLKEALPISITNSIFVRYGQNEMDLMKGLIIGSADTPYSSGCFLYDIKFGENYPNCPPEVNLIFFQK